MNIFEGLVPLTSVEKLWPSRQINSSLSLFHVRIQIYITFVDWGHSHRNENIARLAPHKLLGLQKPEKPKLLCVETVTVQNIQESYNNGN